MEATSEPEALNSARDQDYQGCQAAIYLFGDRFILATAPEDDDDELVTVLKSPPSHKEIGEAVSRHLSFVRTDFGAEMRRLARLEMVAFTASGADSIELFRDAAFYCWVCAFDQKFILFSAEPFAGRSKKAPTFSRTVSFDASPDVIGHAVWNAFYAIFVLYKNDVFSDVAEELGYGESAPRKISSPSTSIAGTDAEN